MRRMICNALIQAEILVVTWAAADADAWGLSGVWRLGSIFAEVTLSVWVVCIILMARLPKEE